jgi:diacylglycerol kinase (ATP)
VKGAGSLRIRTIINPSSGRQYYQHGARQIVKILLDDHTVSQAEFFETQGKFDAYEAARSLVPGAADLLLVAGADGTVNEALNGLVASGQDIPLAILPSGTSNDFAYFMKLPRGIQPYCKMIRNFKTKRVDIGRIGNTCFLNAAAVGILSDLSFKVSSEAKTVLGQLAYVLGGAIDLPNKIYNSIPISIHAEQKTIEDDILLFIVTNTSSVGGFRNMAPLARPDDGKLDVLVVHRQGFLDAVPLFVQLVNGDHLNNSKITFFQTDRLDIAVRDKSPVQMDIDGEMGPHLPVTIEAVHHAIQVLIP